MTKPSEPGPSRASANRATVVLLHGLARRHGSLAKLAAELRADGYRVWAQSYPSRRLPIAVAAAQLSEQLVAEVGDAQLCAVTHSMGGILFRHLHDPRLRWQRAVMLAPPNAGSRLAATLSAYKMFRWFYGPAGIELGAGTQWPEPPAPYAVIAGTRSFALTNVTSWTVGRMFGPQRANDGTVAVDETKLPSMAAFAEVDATHTWIMNDPEAIALTKRFLAQGRF